MAVARSSARVARRAVIASPSERSIAARASASAAASATRERQAIPGPSGFDHCLKRSALLRQGVFAFHVVPVDAIDDSAPWRLGLVIPKRFEASAVARNAIKRRWREAFRVRRVDWTHEFGGADLVIRMTAPLVTKVEAASLTATQRARFDAAALLAAFAQRMRARAQNRSPAKASA